jgi:hypothetical protein
VMTTKRPRQSTTAKAKTNSREDTIRPIQQRAILLRARSKLLEAEGPRSLSAAARRAHKSREGGREEAEERGHSEPSRRRNHCVPQQKHGLIELGFCKPWKYQGSSRPPQVHNSLVSSP